MIRAHLTITAPPFLNPITVEQEITTDEATQEAFLQDADHAIQRALSMVMRGEVIQLLRSTGIVTTQVEGVGEMSDADMRRFIERDCA
jgi:hypothetical protein